MTTAQAQACILFPTHTYTNKQTNTVNNHNYSLSTRLINQREKKADATKTDMRGKKGGSGFFTLFLCVQWLHSSVFSIGHTGQ